MEEWFRPRSFNRDVNKSAHYRGTSEQNGTERLTDLFRNRGKAILGGKGGAMRMWGGKKEGGGGRETRRHVSEQVRLHGKGKN